MSREASLGKMSYAEYLVVEARGAARHEYLRGEVLAMAGGTPEHAALALAIGAELRTALAGRPCRVYSSDLRVRIRETVLTTYPDIAVVCGRLETDPEDPDAATNPTVLVEVLSDSSEAYDRGAKAAHYRRIPSLREYVLVSQNAPLIEVHRKNDQGVWEIHEARAGGRLELSSLGITVSVDLVYANPLAS